MCACRSPVGDRVCPSAVSPQLLVFPNPPPPFPPGLAPAAEIFRGERGERRRRRGKLSNIASRRGGKRGRKPALLLLLLHHHSRLPVAKRSFALVLFFLPPSLPPRLLPMELSNFSNGAVGRNGGGGVRLKRCPPPHRRQLQQQSTNGRRGTELSVAGKTPQRLRRLRRGRRGGGWDRSRGLHRAGRRVWCVGPSSQCRQGRKFAAAEKEEEEEEETVAVAQAGFGGGACAAVVTATQRGEEDGRVLPSLALLSWSYLLRRR